MLNCNDAHSLTRTERLGWALYILFVGKEVSRSEMAEVAIRLIFRGAGGIYGQLDLDDITSAVVFAESQIAARGEDEVL